MKAGTCEERVESALKSRLQDLQELVTSQDYDELLNYPLSFDYVPLEEGEGHGGYFRYQMSWGGPADEFRVYAELHPTGWEITKIEYWFLDWFDSAHRELHGEPLEFVRDFVLTNYSLSEAYYN